MTVDREQLLGQLREKYGGEIEPDPQFGGFAGRCPRHDNYVSMFFNAKGISTGCMMHCTASQIAAFYGDTEAAKAARANGVEAPKTQWLIMGKDCPKPILENIILVMSTDEWNGTIVFDELEMRPLLRSATPAHRARGATSGIYPRGWDDADDALVTAWMQSTLALYVKPGQIRDAVIAIARQHSFHPVRQYLDALQWDGQKRIDDWLYLYLGCPDTPLVRAFAAKFLISAVARVRNPGEKVDHMLILEGKQGSKKSTALEALCPSRDYFTDDLGDSLGKDSAERIVGKWIVEVAELDSMSRAEANRIKAFITRPTDRFRPAYGRWSVDFKRQCVFAGTTNSDDYLKDETGGRRFWPVQVGEINLAGLRASRDQLWAEAALRHKAGEAWWIEDGLLEDAAKEEQRKRLQEDVWSEQIATFVLGRNEVTVCDILAHIGLKSDRQEQSHKVRVAKTLKSMGWYRHQIRLGGVQSWVYSPSPLSPVKNEVFIRREEIGG